MKSAQVVMDQTKSYEIIPHLILKEQLKNIGFGNQALNTMYSNQS